jgi:hypothetical protein
VDPRAVLDTVVKDNIKIDIKEAEFEDTDWIRLIQDRVQLRAFVKTVTNLRVSRKEENFLSNSVILRFSRRTLLHRARVLI